MLGACCINEFKKHLINQLYLEFELEKNIGFDPNHHAQFQQCTYYAACRGGLLVKYN